MKRGYRASPCADFDAGEIRGRPINIDHIVEAAVAELEARSETGFYGNRETPDETLAISTSPALAVRATLTSGAVYHVLVVEAENYAVAQPDEDAGWEYVCLSDLSLPENPGMNDIVRAVLDEVFGALG